MRRMAKFVFCVMIIALLPPLAVADAPAPAFDLPALEGEQRIALKDLRGKVVYLDFWASWCGPCRQSLPALNALYHKLAELDFEIIAINLDAEANDALRFLERYPVDYPVLVDRSGATPQAYALTGLPTSVLIDQHGVLVASFEGFNPEHLVKLEQAVRILLAE